MTHKHSSSRCIGQLIVPHDRVDVTKHKFTINTNMHNEYPFGDIRHQKARHEKQPRCCKVKKYEGEEQKCSIECINNEYEHHQRVQLEDHFINIVTMVKDTEGTKPGSTISEKHFVRWINLTTNISTWKTSKIIINLKWLELIAQYLTRRSTTT